MPKATTYLCHSFASIWLLSGGAKTKAHYRAQKARKSWCITADGGDRQMFEVPVAIDIEMQEDCHDDEAKGTRRSQFSSLSDQGNLLRNI
ncbi:uncharacterized protein UHOD_11485 [Ustilago sp. UG-2017b]|nr:uncharacterized protein UHOD_11485 [Ustilago sp. UG-2017b]